MYHRGFRTLLPDALWYCRLGGSTSKRSAKAVIRGNLVAIDIICKSTDMNIKLNNWNFTISTYSSAMTRYSGVLSEPVSSTVSKLTFSSVKESAESATACGSSYLPTQLKQSQRHHSIIQFAFQGLATCPVLRVLSLWKSCLFIKHKAKRIQLYCWPTEAPNRSGTERMMK